MAWVPQHASLVRGTVAENIRLGDPSAPDGRVREAAELAGADSFIRALPEGYETVVGDGGRPLSAGERRRLALARAFLRDAPFVILDEPTADLDPANAEAVADAVERLSAGRTVLVLAHRPGAGPPRRSRGRPRRRPRMTTTLRRLLALADAPRGRVALSVVLGALTVLFGVGLMATAGYLISRAAERPAVLSLTVAIVLVRFFGLARPLARYLERLASHDLAFRVLGRVRVRAYERLEPLAPAQLEGYRQGDLLSRMVADVDALQNLHLRGVGPPACGRPRGRRVRGSRGRGASLGRSRAGGGPARRRDRGARDRRSARPARGAAAGGRARRARRGARRPAALRARARRLRPGGGAPRPGSRRGSLAGANHAARCVRGRSRRRARPRGDRRDGGRRARRLRLGARGRES